MPSYNTLLRNFLAEEELHEQYKRDTIVKMAHQLEKEEYPTNEINDRIAHDVEPKITRAYVGQVLEDKYKNKVKIHKKKEVIELAADGSVIESDKSRLEREEEEKNRIGHEELLQDLNKAHEAGSKAIESLDQVVLKELDQVRDERKELQTRLNSALDELQKEKAQNQEIMEFIEENLGYYMVFDKDEDKIYVKEIDSEKADTRKQLKIDLRKFEDNIKNSFQKGKHVAEIRHNGTNVTSWK